MSPPPAHAARLAARLYAGHRPSQVPDDRRVAAAAELAGYPEAVATEAVARLRAELEHPATVAQLRAALREVASRRSGLEAIEAWRARHANDPPPEPIPGLTGPSGVHIPVPSRERFEERGLA